MDDKGFDYDYYEQEYGLDLRSILGEESAQAPQEPDEPAVPDEPEMKKNRRKAEREGGARMELYDWLQCVVSAVLCGILLFVFVGRVIGVDGTSMLQTLRDGDKIVMSNLLYNPKYGDIVVLRAAAYEDTPLVKRVIAVEGETVDIDFETGDVAINGNVIEESYINGATMTREDFSGPVTVPEGCVFVMGDNRNASTDSRSDLVGMVDTRQLLGKVLFVIIPGPDDGGGRSWSRIGSVYR